MQYDRRTPIDMRHMNGVAPMTLSNLMNDFSIEKRAEHIASRVFKTPKSKLNSFHGEGYQKLSLYIVPAKLNDEFLLAHYF